jgi:DNA modification methylase
MQWPADAVSRRPVKDLTAYAKNARTHSDDQIAHLARLIAAYGWTSPVLVDTDGVLIAGHGRVLAAERLGIDAVPCMVADGWTPQQVAAYRLADNASALQAGWDAEAVRFELAELDAAGFDLDMSGFTGTELAAFMVDTTEGLTDPDDVPELQAEPVTAPGDVWVMGRHRLCCGDSTTTEAVDAALNGVKPHLMVTDPPYGVDYDAGWRNEAMPEKNDPKRWKDGAGSPTGAVMNDTRADWSEAYALFPGDVAYVWHPPGARQVEFFTSLVAAGFEVRMQIIWAKSHFPIGRGNYHVQHEPCWYAVRKGATGHWSGDRKQTTLWQIAKPAKSETGHSTQKPVECMKRPIENNSSPGQAVYDPFVGSGTTIIAAEMTGRAAHCIEISPQYCDVSVRRWMAFTGQSATLETTGRTFDETELGRTAAIPAEA